MTLYQCSHSTCILYIVYSSAPAAGTQYHRLGGFRSRNEFFLQFWGLEIQDQSCCQVSLFRALAWGSLSPAKLSCVIESAAKDSTGHSYSSFWGPGLCSAPVSDAPPHNVISTSLNSDFYFPSSLELSCSAQLYLCSAGGKLFPDREPEQLWGLPRDPPFFWGTHACAACCPTTARKLVPCVFSPVYIYFVLMMGGQIHPSESIPGFHPEVETTLVSKQLTIINYVLLFFFF